MTNKQLVKLYQRLRTADLKLTRVMIDEGFGHLRGSDMRADPTCHRLAPESNRLRSEMDVLDSEARRRYGPGFIYVGQLG